MSTETSTNHDPESPSDSELESRDEDISTDKDLTPLLLSEEDPVAVGEKLLERLSEDYHYTSIYAAVSGGDDSMTALRFAHNSPHIELDGVVHMDTGIGVSETREFVEKKCEELGLDLIVLGDSNARYSNEMYSFLIQQNGFPGIPVHSTMWKNLKDKPLGRWRRAVERIDEKEGAEEGKVALISGVRKHESDNRYEYLSDEAIQEISGAIWASPLVDFTDQDMSEYRDKHDIEPNPVAALLCISGECLCGAYGNREKEIQDLQTFYPQTAGKIHELEWLAVDMAARGEIKKKHCLWAHGSMDEGEYDVRVDPDQEKISCSDCEDNCSTPYEMGGEPLTPAEEYLLNNHLSDHWNWPFYCAICDEVTLDPYTHRQEVHPFDAEDGLAGAWDMRMIDVSASHNTEYIITEPNGWNLDVSQLTNKSKADQYKNYYYYEDYALSHCDNHGHSWTDYNDGPVEVCEDCGAFELSDYDPVNPGPPTITPDEEQEKTLTPTQRKQKEIHQSLDQFK